MRLFGENKKRTIGMSWWMQHTWANGDTYKKHTEVWTTLSFAYHDEDFDEYTEGGSKNDFAFESKALMLRNSVILVKKAVVSVFFISLHPKND